MGPSHGALQTVTTEGGGEGLGRIGVGRTDMGVKSWGVGRDADGLCNHGHHRPHIRGQGGCGCVVGRGRGDGRHEGRGQGVLQGNRIRIS